MHAGNIYSGDIFQHDMHEQLGVYSRPINKFKQITNEEADYTISSSTSRPLVRTQGHVCGF